MNKTFLFILYEKKIYAYKVNTKYTYTLNLSSESVRQNLYSEVVNLSWDSNPGPVSVPLYFIQSGKYIEVESYLPPNKRRRGRYLAPRHERTVFNDDTFTIILSSQRRFYFDLVI